jgi:hypothetical protein
MREGNALGLLTESGPRASIFGSPDSCALTNEAYQGSKSGDESSGAEKTPEGKKFDQIDIFTAHWTQGSP